MREIAKIFFALILFLPVCGWANDMGPFTTTPSALSGVSTLMGKEASEIKIVVDAFEHANEDVVGSVVRVKKDVIAKEGKARDALNEWAKKCTEEKKKKGASTKDEPYSVSCKGGMCIYWCKITQCIYGYNVEYDGTWCEEDKNVSTLEEISNLTKSDKILNSIVKYPEDVSSVPEDVKKAIEAWEEACNKYKNDSAHIASAKHTNVSSGGIVQERCIIKSCVDGYGVWDDKCVKDGAECKPEVDNATKGVFNANTAECELTDCEDGYTVSGKECVSNKKAERVAKK